VVGCNQFILAMVRLATLNFTPSVDSNLGKLGWSVHPVDPGVDVPFIACAYLQKKKNGARDSANQTNGKDIIYEGTQNGYCTPKDESTVEARQLAIIKDKEDISTTTTSQYNQESPAPAKRFNTASQAISQCEYKRNRLYPITAKGHIHAITKKRERNKVAAQKSRDRKARRLEELEEKVRMLEAERGYWKCAAMASGAIQS
jgi:hypothetical protein